MNDNNKEQSQEIILYTDGACTGNPWPGGRGVVIIQNWNEKPILLSWKSKHTTNNQMELTAVIKGLERLCGQNNISLPDVPSSFTGFNFEPETKNIEALKHWNIVAIYLDSQYVKQGMEERIANRKRNGRRTSWRKPVANKELRQELDALTHFFEIKWHRVKGHNGNKYNEMADKLAIGRLKSNIDSVDS